MRLMQIMQITARKAEVADPALIKELEQEFLLLQGLEIVAVHMLFTLAGKESRDIMKTIQLCIKEARKCKTQCVVKMIIQLICHAPLPHAQFLPLTQFQLDTSKSKSLSLDLD